MLEGLQDKFVDERVSLEKEEATKRHTYAARRFLGVQIGQGGVRGDFTKNSKTFILGIHLIVRWFP